MPIAFGSVFANSITARTIIRSASPGRLLKLQPPKLLFVKLNSFPSTATVRILTKFTSPARLVSSSSSSSSNLPSGMSEYNESFQRPNKSQTSPQQQQPQQPQPQQQNKERPYNTPGADSRGTRYGKGGYYGGSNYYSGHGNNNRGRGTSRGHNWTPRGGRGNFQNYSRRFNDGGPRRSNRNADIDVPMLEQQESDTQHGKFGNSGTSSAQARGSGADVGNPHAAYTRRNDSDDYNRRSPSPYAARNSGYGDSDGDSGSGSGGGTFGSYSSNNDKNTGYGNRSGGYSSYANNNYGNREGYGRDNNSYSSRGSRSGRGGYSNYVNYKETRDGGYCSASSQQPQQQQQRHHHHRSFEQRVELDKSFWQNEMPDVVVSDEECEKIDYFEILAGGQQKQNQPAPIEQQEERELATEKLQQPQQHIDVVEKKALAFYSRDENLQRYYNSTSSLRYYNRPRVTRSKTTNRPIYNLLENWQSYKPFVYNRAVPRLTGTLWVLSQFEKNQSSQKNEAEVSPVKIDFVSNKGPLVKLMSLASKAIASSKYVSLDLNIATVGNMIMMSNNNYREIETAKDLQNAYVGHKFESVITSEKHPSEIDDWRAMQRKRFTCPLTNNENFKILAHVVIKNVGVEAEANAHSDSHSVVMSSEMDCCLEKNNDPYDLSNYAEIKTHFSASRGEAFEKKLYLAYLQSFFTGMSKVIIGFRDSSGYLLGIKEFQVDEIPSMIDQERFNIAKSKDFLHRVLGWIKLNVEFGVEGKAVWRLNLDHKSKRLELRKITNDKYVEKITRFIYPESFAQHRRELSDEILGKK